MSAAAAAPLAEVRLELLALELGGGLVQLGRAAPDRFVAADMSFRTFHFFF